MRKFRAIIESPTQPDSTDVIWVCDGEIKYFNSGKWDTISSSGEVDLSEIENKINTLEESVYINKSSISRIDNSLIDTKRELSQTNANLTSLKATVEANDVSDYSTFKQNTNGHLSGHDSAISYLTTSVDELEDSVFPITINWGLSFNAFTKKVTISSNYTKKGAAYTTPKVVISCTNNVANTTTDLASRESVSSLNIEHDVKVMKETFTIKLMKSDNTVLKSASAIRHLNYIGVSSKSTLTESDLSSFGLNYQSGIDGKHTVTTTAGQYIYILVPKDLTINKVTSDGFTVTLNAATTLSTSLGTYKVYRTANTLTANKWALVVS